MAAMDMRELWKNCPMRQYLNGEYEEPDCENCEYVGQDGFSVVDNAYVNEVSVMDTDTDEISLRELWMNCPFVQQ